MKKVNIDLVWIDDGFDLASFRIALKSALETAGCSPYWREWQIGSAHYPTRLAGSKENGIVVNGKFILLDRSLNQEKLVLLLKKYSSKRQISLTGISANVLQSISMIGLILFPKCALCWMTYFSLFAQLGIRIPYAPQTSYVLIGLSVVFIIYLFCKRKLTGIVAPTLMLCGLLLVICSKYFLNDSSILNATAMACSMGATLIIIVPKKYKLTTI